MEDLNKALQELHDDMLALEELAKGPNYWKDKDPKKYKKMLSKLKGERKKPGSKERGYQQVLQAKRREKGGSGTTSGQNGKSGHSSGRMKTDTGTAAKRYASAETKHGKKMSMNRKNNNKGYGSGNTELISQKYNRGDENYSKKAPEKMSKASPKSIIAGAALAGMLSAPAATTQAADLSPKVNEKVSMQQDSFTPKMLRTIASVESSGGKNLKHEKLPETNPIHQGTRAFGKYGLTSALIQETAKLNKDIGGAHPELSSMSLQDVNKYMAKNPKLEDKIAAAHVKRLSKIFGNDPAKIGHAWLNGITGTKNAIKSGEPVKEHWHVKKILKAFNK